MKAKALYPFATTDQTQVSFAAGEDLVILDNPSGTWIWVRNVSGKEGYAPTNFLQLPPPGENGYLEEKTNEVSLLDEYVAEQPIDTGPQYANADEEIKALRSEGWIFLEDDSEGRMFCYHPTTDIYKFPKLAKKPAARVDISNSSNNNSNATMIPKTVHVQQQPAARQATTIPPPMLSGNTAPVSRPAASQPTSSVVPPPAKLTSINSPPPPSRPNPSSPSSGNGPQPPPPKPTASNTPPPPSSGNGPQPPPPKPTTSNTPPPPSKQGQPPPPALSKPAAVSPPPPPTISTSPTSIGGGQAPPRPLMQSPTSSMALPAALMSSPTSSRPVFVPQMSLINIGRDGRDSNLGVSQSISSFSEADMVNFVNSVRSINPEAIVTELFLKQKKGVFSGFATAAEMSVWSMKIPKIHLLIKTQALNTSRVLQVFDDISDYMGESYLAAGGAEGGSKATRLFAKIGQYETLCSVTSHGEGNNDVRDEIFVFLIRQTTQNPNLESFEKGWELLASCSSVFVPTTDKLLFLLRRHADNFRSRPDGIGGLAIRVWQRLVPGTCGGPPDRVTSEGLTLIKRTFIPATVFGASLEGILRKEAFGDNPFCVVARQLLVREPRVPLVLRLLAGCVLRLNGVQCEGIFRITGGTDNAKQARLEMSDGRYDALYNTLQIPTNAPIRRSGNQNSSRPPSGYQMLDAIEAADVFKQWLRSLSEPLIPFAAYEACIVAGRMSSTARCVDIINNPNVIPEANRACLLFILGFCCEIAKNSQANKMDTSNLALVMSPNLMKSERDSAESFARNSEYERLFIQFLLDVAMATSKGSNINGIQLPVGEFWNQQALQFN